MKVTVVYGTERKACTYNIAQQFLKNLDKPVITEIFLPRDLPTYCVSCFRCFSEEKGVCTNNEYVKPIREKLLDADLIILTSPVYAYHVSGQMKVFLDHFSNMWMVHRPEEKMFKKQGLVISSASGPVFKKSLNEMKDSLDFWGVCKSYKLGFALFETRWDHLSSKLISKINKKSYKIAATIERKHGKIKPYFRVRKWFYLSRLMQKYIGANPPDKIYWEEMGWSKKTRPWKG